jgi:glycosyltransferase involved in cell wall biosynthesis
VNIWREIVADGGGLAEAPNADSFAAAMTGLLQDEPHRLAMGRAALASVARRYQWSAIAPDLERIYARVAATRRPGGADFSAAARG